MQSSSQIGFQKYIAELDPGEKQDCRYVSMEDFIAGAQSLKKSRLFRSRAHRFLVALDPLVQFVNRYASAVDTMVQYDVNPSAIIWGALKALLTTIRSYSHYVGSMIAMVTQVADFVVLYARYEKLFSRENSFPDCEVCRIFIRSVWKGFECDFKDTIESLSRHKSLLEAETVLCHREHLESELQEQATFREDSRDLLRKLVVSSAQREEAIAQHANGRREICNWLAPLDLSETLVRLLGRRTPNTGGWIFEQPTFLDWFNLRSCKTPTRTLWIYGAPGSGKTILSASIIEWLGHRQCNHEKRCVAYFYCDYKDNRKVSLMAIVRCLMAQMIAHLDLIPEEVCRARESAIRFGRSSLSMSDQPLNLIRVIAGRLTATHLVVDGLDECEDPLEIANALTNLVETSENIHIIFLSRDSPPLRTAFQTEASIKLTTDFLAPDIDKYLTKSLEKLSHIEATTRESLFKIVSAKAQGMFLWVRLVVDNIASATSALEIGHIIDELPQGLNRAYEQALDRLIGGNPRTHSFAMNVLSWACCSLQPLTVPELQVALSWDNEVGAFSEAKRPFKKAVVGTCSPLLEHLEVDDTLQLVHLSVRSFLCNNVRDLESSSTECKSRIGVAEAHCKIAEICIEQLCLPDVAHAVDVNGEHFPFAKYATLNWCQHLILSQGSPSLCTKVMQLMSKEENRRTWIRRYMRLKRSAFPLQELVRLQKTITDLMHAISVEKYEIDDLADLQYFLFHIEHAVGDHHSDIGTTNFERVLLIRDLAREYTQRGRLNDGITWLKQSLAAVRHLHGPDSVQSTWILNSLGILFDQQDEVQTAMDMQIEALRIQELILPHDHIDVSLTINEMGRIYRHMEKYQESEEMHLRALAILRATLPEDDLQIIWTKNTLGRNHVKQGRISESIELHEQALAGQQRILGEDHPHVLWTMTDIARCLCGRRDFVAALAMQHRAFDARLRVLGAHHADTLWSMNSLGLVLEKLGRWDEAKMWHTRAWEGQTVYLGPSHKHTVWSLETLKHLPSDT